MIEGQIQRQVLDTTRCDLTNPALIKDSDQIRKYMKDAL